MNGRVYAMNREKSLVAVETEWHGVIIIELLDQASVEMGDPFSWDSDLDDGPQRYKNLGTGLTVSVLVRAHMVSKSEVRKHLSL